MIVKSILDTDLYKFTTSYAYMKLFPQARGTFEFFDKCQDIMEYCGSRIRCSFGIGTNLTNDTGFKPANIVMKLISCQMNVNQPVYGCVKLSDDKGKHTGEMREVKSCLSELGL